MPEKETFYIVNSEILPAAIVKTALAKDLIKRKEAGSPEEAAKALGIARSTYYKYKDKVFTFSQMENLSIITIYLLLRNDSGVLSRVLNYLACSGGNILTINQNIPINGTAWVSLALEITRLKVSVDELGSDIKQLPEVISYKLLGNIN